MQELSIEGTLLLETTNCNGNLIGLVQVWSPEGGIISSAEIISARTAPAPLNLMYVVVYEEETVPVVSILNFEQTLVEADEFLMAEEESVTFQSHVQVFPDDVVAGDCGATVERLDRRPIGGHWPCACRCSDLRLVLIGDQFSPSFLNPPR